jgi:hypothetical protein
MTRQRRHYISIAQRRVQAGNVCLNIYNDTPEASLAFTNDNIRQAWEIGKAMTETIEDAGYECD